MAERYPEIEPYAHDWLYHGVGRFFPGEWARFRDGAGAAGADGDLVAAYYRLLQDDDPAVREQAARDWCLWEDTVVSLEGHGPNPRYDDPRFRMCFARVVTRRPGHDRVPARGH